nr:MAG TPA: hypothetical protein [Caudoviricetes sp.]
MIVTLRPSTHDLRESGWFNSAVFFTLKEELGFENAKTCKNDLKTSFETA